MKGVLEFDQLAKRSYIYDSKKATDLSKLQEAYINELRKNYEQMRLEVEPLIMRSHLLQQERMQLMDELAVYKQRQQELFTQLCEKEKKEQKLADQTKKQEAHIKQLSAMQMPREFQEQKCNELKDSLLNILKTYIQDFLDEYTQGLDDGQEDFEPLLEQLISNVDDAVMMFVQNLPAQSSRGSNQNEELQHYKNQIQTLIANLESMKQESLDYQTALETEKQYSQKVITQRNNLSAENLQFQKQKEQLHNEIEQLKQQNSFLEIKAKEYLTRTQEAQLDHQKYLQNFEQEKDQLKSELVNSIKQLQQELQKYQQENQQLLQQIDNLHKQINDLQDQSQQQNQELENKLKQESLKLEQKNREFQRIDREFQQNKQELDKLFNEKTELSRSMDVLKEKRTKDKEYMEKQKEKLKKQQQEYADEKEMLTKELEDNKQLIIQLKQQIEDFHQQHQVPAENQNYIEKELQIAKSEQIIQELKTKIEDQKQKLIQQSLQINTQQASLDKLVSQNKQLNETRNYARQEIQRLTKMNEQLKKQIKQVDTNRTNQSIVVGKAQTEYDPNSSIRTDNSDKTKNGHSHIFPFNFIPQIPQQKQDSVERKMAEEAILFQTEDLREQFKELYKQFMIGLMLNDENPELLKLERYINDCLSKTQDLFDSIQDLKTL